MVYRRDTGPLRFGEVVLVVWVIQSQNPGYPYDRQIIMIRGSLEGSKVIVEELIHTENPDLDVHWSEYPEGEWWPHWHTDDGTVAAAPILVERKEVE